MLFMIVFGARLFIPRFIGPVIALPIGRAVIISRKTRNRIEKEREREREMNVSECRRLKLEYANNELCYNDYILTVFNIFEDATTTTPRIIRCGPFTTRFTRIKQ